VRSLVSFIHPVKALSARGKKRSHLLTKIAQLAAKRGQCVSEERILSKKV